MWRKFFSLNLILLLISSFSSSLYSQYAGWMNYTYGRWIYAVAESEHFIWVGTHGGLVKIDKNTSVTTFFNKGNSWLPDNFIYSLAIDGSQNVWIGTYSGGLAKFDGRQWTVYNTLNSGLPDNSVWSIAIDNSQNIWVGTQAGGLAKFDGAKWTVFNTSNSGLKHNWIRSIAIDDLQNKWIGTTSGGLHKFDGTNWIHYGYSDSPLPSNQINTIAIDIYQNKWIGTQSGLAKFDGTNWTVYNIDNSGLPSNRIKSIAIDDSQNKWIGTSKTLTESGGLVKFDNINWILYNTSNSYLPSDNINSILIDNYQNKWIGTAAGLVKLYENNLNIYNTSNSGLLDWQIYTIAVDGSQNKWIGSLSGGLAKFDGTDWKIYTESNSGLPNNCVYSVAIDAQQNKWIATEGGVAKFEGTNWTTYQEFGLRIYIIAIDDLQNKWIGTQDGLYKFDGENHIYYSPSNSGLPGWNVSSIIIDNSQNKWIGTDKGLALFDDTNWIVYNTSNSGLPSSKITSIALDGSQNKWIGTDKGLAKFDGANWQLYDISNSLLPDNNVTSIAVDAWQNVWIGTINGGLAKFDGTNWTVFNTSNSGLPDNYIKSITIDGLKNKWIGCWRGGVAVYLNLGPLAIGAPNNNEKWQVEENHYITWTAEGITSLKIEYSSDDGNSWNIIEHSYPANVGKYAWIIPNLTSNKCRIKLSDATNPATHCISNRFTIKGYILSRYNAQNDTYEIFDVAKHGWCFSNLDGVDFSANPPDFTNAILWPKSWWSQFSYINLYPRYFFLKVQSKQWPKQNDFPDLPLIIEYYGESQCYLDWPKDSVFDQKVIEFWAAIYLPVRQGGGWRGSCYGLAVSCFLAFQDPVKFYTNEKFHGMGEFTNLHDLDINDERRKVINGLFTYQFEKNQLYYVALQSQMNPKDIVDDIIKMFKNEQGEYRVLNLMNQYQSANHAVNPYIVRRWINYPYPDIWEIYVYDNNLPDNSNMKVIVFNVGGTWKWSYDMNPNDPYNDLWGGDKGLSLTSSVDIFYFPPLIPQKKSNLYEGKNTDDLSEYIQFYNTTSSSIIIKNSKGKTISFDDSVAFNNLKDGTPIIPADGVFQPPIGYFLPKDKYNIKMNNYSDSLSYFNVFTDSIIYIYSRENSNSNENDYLIYDNGICFSNKENILKIINLGAIIYESDYNKIYQTCNINISTNDSIKINKHKKDQMAIANFGQDKIYMLRIISISIDNEVIFEHSDVKLSLNARHIINPDWGNLKSQPVKIFVDENIDGVIDDTLLFENQYTGVKENSQNASLTPEKYELMQNYPNPFNSTTHIRFGIPKDSHIKITVYSLLGQHVAEILNDNKNAGYYTIKFDGSGLSSGIYLYRIQAGDFVQTKKMIIIK